MNFKEESLKKTKKHAKILKNLKILLILSFPRYIFSKYVYLDNIYWVERKGWVKMMTFSWLTIFFLMYFLLLWKSVFKIHLKIENLME